MNKQGPNKIEYLDYTWGPVSGCLHGCEYCYMKRMARRFPDKISMAPAVHYRVARYNPHHQQLTLLVQEANSYRQMTAAEFNAEAFYFDGDVSTPSADRY